VTYRPRELLLVSLRTSLPGVIDFTQADLRRTRLLPLQGPSKLVPGPVIDAREQAKRIARLVKAFRAGARRVVSNPEIMSGAPVFEGTRIPVEQVGQMLVRGDSEDDLLADFPALKRSDLVYARAVVARGRGRGRPRLKPIEFRR
jgi:uncharacterized protein (DUF433 family)